MPYIHKDHRAELDPAIDALIAQLKVTGGGRNNVEGCLNYIITRLLLSILVKPSYRTFNALIGVLEACKLEFYARHVRPYEDGKIRSNGDVR